ncbi:MAG: glycosyltransferase family 9 protein [Candidatus Bruticola sp.]
MQKILIVHTGGGLGDVLLSTAVIEALKFNYPEAEIDFLVRSSNSAALKGNPLIANILTLNSARLSWTEVIKWAKKLRARSYDASIILWSNAPLAFMLYFAGIPIRVGQDSRLTYSWTYTHPVRVRSEHGDCSTHWCEIMLDFVRALHLPVPPVKPRFVISDRAKEKANHLLQALPPGQGPIIGIHPSKGISNPDKRWPISVFASWIKGLYNELQARIFLTGGPQEVNLTSKIIAEADVPCLNLAGQTDTEVLAAVAQHCQLFICPDSGPAHLAAISGVTVLDIFALKEDFPQRWRAPGPHTTILVPKQWECQRVCRKNQCPDFQCYTQIDSKLICSIAKNLLSRTEKEHE